MKTYIKIIPLLLFICFPFFCMGQTYTKGLILPDNDSDSNCCILSPMSGLDLYDQPGGKKVASLKRTSDEYSIYLLKNGKETKIELESLKEIGYEIFAIKFIDKVDGFVKVLDEFGGYWLSINEMKKKDFDAVSWMDFLIRYTDKVLGYYAEDPGLRLRATPGIDGEVTGSVKGDLFEIKLSRKTNGSWNLVTVTKYREHPCGASFSEEENLEYKTEGWMKVVDDDGEPNIWFYTRGC